MTDQTWDRRTPVRRGVREHSRSHAKIRNVPHWGATVPGEIHAGKCQPVVNHPALLNINLAQDAFRTGGLPGRGMIPVLAPKGLCISPGLSSQRLGYPGGLGNIRPTPKGLCKTPLRIAVVVFRIRAVHNPFGVEDGNMALTQGSGGAATLGYCTESRWDSRSMKTVRNAY